MDTIQIILVIVVVTFTIMIVVIGFQVLLVLSDLRRVLKRFSGILEDTILGGGLIKPGKLLGVLEMFKKGKKINTRGTHEPMETDSPESRR